jgi:16S rRNA (uracil1498-N3)-methyltransferase
MALRMFFFETLGEELITLDEDNSKHIINVLRMQNGDELLLTDGKGKKATAVIVDDNRKKCVVKVQRLERDRERERKVTIAISLVKNSSRFEWFLEKATEIGVDEIIPLLCERTEKEKFRFDRMQGILISAMLQSQQCWLPVLHQPTEFGSIIQSNNYQQKFIAHCEHTNKQQLTDLPGHYSGLAGRPTSQLMLIGPEGDFTSTEIKAALENGFTPVSLGNTRLRTETAGIVSAVLLKIS